MKVICTYCKKIVAEIPYNRSELGVFTLCEECKEVLREETEKGKAKRKKVKNKEAA